MRVYFFGCWDRAGHFLYDHHGRNIGLYKKDFSERGLPWEQLDGTLCPDDTRKEGVVKIHCAKGWTAAAFWDYSVDTRPGSNSVFLYEDLLDFDEAINEFKENFPKIYSRFNFELTEWIIPEER